MGVADGTGAEIIVSISSALLALPSSRARIGDLTKVNAMIVAIPIAPSVAKTTMVFDSQLALLGQWYPGVLLLLALRMSSPHSTLM